MYLSYDEYRAMGGALEADAFDRLEAKAERQINRATHDRLESAYGIPDAVRYCTYDLIGAMRAEDGLGGVAAGRVVTGMSNDGVSMSFAATGATAAMAASARYMGIIRSWLDGVTTEDGVHLLYAGCDA